MVLSVVSTFAAAPLRSNSAEFPLGARCGAVPGPFPGYRRYGAIGGKDFSSAPLQQNSAEFSLGARLCGPDYSRITGVTALSEMLVTAPHRHSATVPATKSGKVRSDSSESSESHEYSTSKYSEFSEFRGGMNRIYRIF